MSQVLLNGHQLPSQAVLDLLRRIAEFFRRDLVVQEADGSHVRFCLPGLQSAYVVMQLKHEALKSPSAWDMGRSIGEMWPSGGVRSGSQSMYIGGGCAPYIWTIAWGGVVMCESGGSLVLRRSPTA